ncbi:CAZyme family GT25 [Penicillium macrosclerotiorum]|uniref:CAZyme family GT25 n=1 Tax=Penicillium macrosclerotiorum TaxID=303699 RepID=UPI00254780CB|nr:CAZyme family GT25 [Penicillium macrosclerotiorum]KAJ5692204.1 CAZyme family GT25 [Penicillium macrosclerotiorum]
MRWALLWIGLTIVILSWLKLRAPPDLLTEGPQPAWDNQQTESDQQAWNNLNDIQNGTLGVQKVFVINFPDRTDKRDNIILASSLSGFVVDSVDGVSPEGINPKTYPYNWNYDHSSIDYARRRAHLNVMQQIVQQRLQSAIVMVDDADWDVSIKTQLQSFAVAIRSLQGTHHNSTFSPYGDDWDILWLGHCGVTCKTNQPYFVTPHDPTIPMPRHFLPYWRDPPDFEGFERPDHARLTCTANDAACIRFYAVSYRGAQRILSALSVSPGGLAEQIDIGAELDVSLGRMCGHGYLQCFAPYPSMTGGYKPAEYSKQPLDTEDDVALEFFEHARSWGVMYSIMLNINNILNGNQFVHATWDDVDVPDAIPEEIYLKRGMMNSPGPHKEPIPYAIKQWRKHVHISLDEPYLEGE